ncbi:MAG: TRAP transporter small permease [Sandaracinaceae bacterium]
MVNASRGAGGLRRLARWLTAVEEACLAVGILGIAALSIGNVLARPLTGGLLFAEELSQFLMVLVTFVGAGYAAGRGRHIRMTAFYDQVPARPRKALALLITATTALLLWALAGLGLSYALGTMRSLGSVSPTLRVPLWIVDLAAPLGLALAGLQYGLAFARNLTSPGVWIAFDHRDDVVGDESVGGL